MWLFLCFLLCLHHSSSGSPSYGSPDSTQPAAVFEQSYDLPTPESYLSTSPSGQNQKNLENYLRTQRQVKDLREPTLMESHIAEYQRSHEDYQNEEEKSHGNRRRRDAMDTQEEPTDRTKDTHPVREFIKFELSDAKVPDKETEMYIQKQRALKEGGTQSKRTEKRMTASESQQVITEMRYGSPRNGRSPGRVYEVYNQKSAKKTPFKIVVPDTKPMQQKQQYKVYGSPSYNYPRYQPQQQQQQNQEQYTSQGRGYYNEKPRGYLNKEEKKLSDYPNKQWWLPINKKRQRPQAQPQFEQYSAQEVDVNRQYITLLQSNILPSSYMVQGFGTASTPSPNPPKFAAVIYKETPPAYYYTQTPKPITEDQARYYVNPYGQPVRVEDVQIQTSEPDKHLGTKNEYVPIRERKVPFKQSPQFQPETSTQASISALNSLIGKRPIQQLQGLSQLLELDRPQDSTSPVMFDLEQTTPLPPPATILKATAAPITKPQQQNVNIQYYQPQYETVLGDSSIAGLSQQQLNAVYNDLVQRHRNQEQRNVRPPPPRVINTERPQYYQYTTANPIQVSHASVTLQTPSDVTFIQENKTPSPKASGSYNRRPTTVETKGYPSAAGSVAITSSSTNSFGRDREDKVSTRNRHPISNYKKQLPKRQPMVSLNVQKTQLLQDKDRTNTETKHNIHKRDLLRTRPKRRLNRQRLLVRPGPLTVPTPPPPTKPTLVTTTTEKISITNPYEHDLFTISVDDFENAFDPKALKEAYDLIGNQDIPANPYASAPAEDREARFYELEDLSVDKEAPSFLRQTVLKLREKNNDFLRTINSAILYNDQNEEKLYREKSLKSGSMRKFDASLNDNGSEEVEVSEEEGVVKPTVMEGKLMSTLRNYVRRDPVKEQLLREVAEQIERQKEQEHIQRQQQRIDKEQRHRKDVKAKNKERSSGERKPLTTIYRIHTRSKRSLLPFHNETTPQISKLHVYTKTLTDPEAVHYNGSHHTDHNFDYNDDVVEEEKATLSVDYEDFSDVRETNSTTKDFASRSDHWLYGGGHSEEDRVNEYDDSNYYHDSEGYYLPSDGDNELSESRYPNSYKAYHDSLDQRTGQKYKLIPVTVFKKVPVADAEEDESLHIDNVNIFESPSAHYRGPSRRPRRPPPKKYRGKGRWHPKHHYHRHRRPSHSNRRKHSKLRKKFPKIKWLLEH